MADEKVPAPIGASLLAGKKSRSHNVVASWNDCPIVPPEVLREWIEQRVGEVNAECRQIGDAADQIKQQHTEDKLRAASLVANSQDFVELANRSMPMLGDDEDPAVAIAFATGL